MIRKHILAQTAKMLFNYFPPHLLAMVLPVSTVADYDCIMVNYESIVVRVSGCGNAMTIMSKLTHGRDSFKYRMLCIHCICQKSSRDEWSGFRFLVPGTVAPRWSSGNVLNKWLSLLWGALEAHGHPREFVSCCYYDHRSNHHKWYQESSNVYVCD